MSKTVRISDTIHSRLASVSEGFETPSETILRLVDFYEVQKSYEMLKAVIEGKADNIKYENLPEQNAAVLMHYDKDCIQKALDILQNEYMRNDLTITYEIPINGMGITLKIEKN